ncbi:MAG: phytoene desaturase [Flavobacteriales bacterium]|nr:phytoene desaturase [Flavobacteriales bacterium]MCB9448562.1 phytoene desaturase [Flavobacteriales bacterium]
MKNTVVIGSGLAGLSSAAYLAKGGQHVTVLEKNDQPGGRVRQFREAGFTFDMGPSWYWMPDVFERFFAAFGKQPSDYYNLVRLDPSYRVFFGDDHVVDVPAGEEAVASLFESMEPGSADQLREFLAEAKQKYELSLNSLIYQPGLSFREYLTPEVIRSIMTLGLFRNISGAIGRRFSNDHIRRILEFPVLFLGAKPASTPSLYSLMNFADIVLGTWYPMGGISRIVDGMADVAREQGVEFRFGEPVKNMTRVNDRIRVESSAGTYMADSVVAAADYHHIEQQVLTLKDRHYAEKYWNRRVLAPSALLFYLGVDRKLPGLQHHNLFFDRDFAQHARQIYDQPQWPDDPLFYVCCPSKTDPSVAPEGKENLFVLIPVAPGLADTEEVRERLFHLVMDRFEQLLGTPVRPDIILKKSYAHRNFAEDYNALKGNAYGLANTLSQTAFLKPTMSSSKMPNLYFAGQLTVPGPGMPPALISGEIAARQILKTLHPSP